MANQGPFTEGIKLTADMLNATLLQYDLAANRPAAGQAGRVFIASDTGVAYRDTGAAWETVIPVDGAAATPSLRTLGTGAQQAAAGNHTHT